MRKMKRFGLILCLAVFLVCFSQNAFASEELLQTVIPMIAEFSENENTVELPVSDMYILYGKERRNDLVLDDVLIAEYEDKREWAWTADQAHEETKIRIEELNEQSKLLNSVGDKKQLSVGNLPVDLKKYEALRQQCDGYINIVGVDSAYMHGSVQLSQNMGYWEAYPFFIGDCDNLPYEDAAYFGLRIMIPVDDKVDQIQDFFIASQKSVAKAYKKMLELNLDINDADKEIMMSFVERIEDEEKVRKKDSLKVNVSGLMGELNIQYGKQQNKPETLKDQTLKDGYVKDILEKYEYEEQIDGSIAIIKYKGNAKKLIIPDEIDGKKVSEVRGFENCESLTHVILPHSVKIIGDQAFSKCSNLIEINLPYGVESIGFRAFFGNTKLKEIIIPESVLNIGESSFSNCYGLTAVFIPQSVKNIGEDAFSLCTNLTAYVLKNSVSDKYLAKWHADLGEMIGLPHENLRIFGKNYDEDFIEKINEIIPNLSTQVIEVTPVPTVVPTVMPTAKHTVIPKPKNTPKPVEFVFGDYRALDYGNDTCEIIRYNGRDRKLVIPKELNGKSVVSLGERSFSNNTALVSVIIPDSVTSFDYSVFKDCTNLEEVSVPSTVKAISNNMFTNCKNLEKITIPDSVTEIVSLAFSGCSKLRNIEIPASVQKISWSAFKNCSALKQITILSKDIVIEDFVFDGCRSLKTIYGYPGSSVEKCAYIYDIDFVSIGISASPKQEATPKPEATKIPLPYKALNAKKSVSGDYEYADMGDGTCVITDWGGTKQNLKIPQKLNGKKVVGIGYEAFTEYDRDEILTSVTIPDGVTVLGAHAFVSCSRLKQITIPDSVITIEEGVFNSCEDLESVTIPKNVTFVGNAAFSGCWSLNSVTVYSENVVFEEGWNGENPFSGCKQLTEIRGISGSSAEKLARDLGVRFVALPKQSKEMVGNGNSNSTRTEYKKGDSGNEVLRIKKRLQELGYYSADAELSDEFNDTMVSRVKRYQRDERLKQTGKVDSDTYRSLMLAN